MLTSLGIIIGISSVIMIIGLTSSAKQAVKKKIYSYGSFGVSITAKRLAPPLEERYVQELQNLPGLKDAAILKWRVGMRISRYGRFLSATVWGADNAYLRMQGRKMLYGREFTESELTNGLRVAIIGDAVRIRFFGFSDPVGQIVYIHDMPFLVIGSLYSRGVSISGEDFDSVCIIPYRLFNQKITGLSKTKTAMYVQAKDERSYPVMLSALGSAMNRIRGIPTGGNKNYDIETNSEGMDLVENISMTMTYLLVSIAAISLIVGGIGIMNIMLVSVSERTREIGIRMAIGARKSDILIHFLIESMTLCGLGGIAGVFVGLFGYALTVLYLGWQFILQPEAILVSFLFACSVGLFFGYYPAKRASDMNPIDALRVE